MQPNVTLLSVIYTNRTIKVASYILADCQKFSGQHFIWMDIE